ncbi:hypothetical protein K0504_09835 [Neiella marina]|uniref:Uncharacterized protein n=1 Tax=Neiella holothuriorum TaxID=2870530 RepID=A0ABS7EG66_9GAMM|nr:hypothetical protein [Neiella holothuriorum]MBW8191337.1 hypothetical protein [Neiella holothuriorum]
MSLSPIIRRISRLRGWLHHSSGAVSVAGRAADFLGYSAAVHALDLLLLVLLAMLVVLDALLRTLLRATRTLRSVSKRRLVELAEAMAKVLVLATLTTSCYVTEATMISSHNQFWKPIKLTVS